MPQNSKFFNFALTFGPSNYGLCPSCHMHFSSCNDTPSCHSSLAPCSSDLMKQCLPTPPCMQHAHILDLILHHMRQTIHANTSMHARCSYIGCPQTKKCNTSQCCHWFPSCNGTHSCHSSLPPLFSHTMASKSHNKFMPTPPCMQCAHI